MQNSRTGDFNQSIEREPGNLDGVAGGFDRTCEECGINFILGGAQTNTKKPVGAFKLSAVRL